MSEFTEVTAENLRLVRGSRGITQDDVAAVLGLQGYHVSNIEKGRRTLSASEKKLLDLYFFGKMPDGIIRQAQDLDKTLDFTESEWRLIQVLAMRAGQTPEVWIRSQIQAYLAYSGELESKKSVPIVSNDASDFADKANKNRPVGGKGSVDIIHPPQHEQAS